jgi:hypothetical protein
MIDLVVVQRSFTTSQSYLIFMAVVTGEGTRIEGENGRVLKESYTKGLHIRHACGSD